MITQKLTDEEIFIEREQKAKISKRINNCGHVFNNMRNERVCYFFREIVDKPYYSYFLSACLYCYFYNPNIKRLKIGKS